VCRRCPLAFPGEPICNEQSVTAADRATFQLARLNFDLEDGGDKFLRKIGSYRDPIRWQHS
jgi:hypothetical protein